MEQRAVSLVQNTDDVPHGTLLNVPSAPSSGPVPEAPVVAANTVSWKTDAQTIISVVGIPAIMAALEYMESLTNLDGFSKQRIIRVVIAAGVGALLAYLRKTQNTVLK